MTGRSVAAVADLLHRLQHWHRQWLKAFEGFADDFSENIGVYKTLFDSNDAHSEDLSPTFQEKLTRFQRLCVLRCIRTDKVTLGIQDFICNEMGPRSLYAQ